MKTPTTCKFAALAAIASLAPMLAADLAAQDTWLQLPSIGHRIDSGAVWDSNRGRVVDFGGSATSGLPTRTYEWDGVQWVERYPEHTPPGVAVVSLAFDQARGETVLYGGTLGNTSTWTWDGHDWQQRFPTATPPDLLRHRMCYDPIREVVVLFGGSTSPFVSYNDETWVWDGANWALAGSGASSPPARSSHGMAWDPVSQRVLMFGGQTGQGSFQDTWSWDGSSWTQLSPATVPPAGSSSTLAPIRCATWWCSTWRTLSRANRGPGSGTARTGRKLPRRPGRRRPDRASPGMATASPSSRRSGVAQARRCRATRCPLVAAIGT